MQIEFSSSGGVTNQELSYRVSTENLTRPQADELERLVESSGAFELEQNDIEPNVTVGRADVITYRLSLSKANRQVTLWMNDITAPAALRPLLARLQQLALQK